MIYSNPDCSPPLKLILIHFFVMWGLLVLNKSRSTSSSLIDTKWVRGMKRELSFIPFSSMLSKSDSASPKANRSTIATPTRSNPQGEKQRINHGNTFSSASKEAEAEDEEFPFPFAPYPIQLDFMKNLYSALEGNQVGIFESPTGTVSCDYRIT